MIAAQHKTFIGTSNANLIIISSCCVLMIFEDFQDINETLWGRYFNTSTLHPIFPYFHVWLKLSDWIHDLGKWTLMVAVMNIGAYPFLVFSELTCYLEDIRIGWLYKTVLWLSHLLQVELWLQSTRAFWKLHFLLPLT